MEGTNDDATRDVARLMEEGLNSRRGGLGFESRGFGLVSPGNYFLTIIFNKDIVCTILLIKYKIINLVHHLRPFTKIKIFKLYERQTRLKKKDIL
jgi:hypothetical protein